MDRNSLRDIKGGGFLLQPGFRPRTGPRGEACWGTWLKAACLRESVFAGVLSPVNQDGGKPGLGASGDTQSNSLGAGLVPCRRRLLGLEPGGFAEMPTVGAEALVLFHGG